jgi:tetratricopeptide (TPR) repeat protein
MATVSIRGNVALVAMLCLAMAACGKAADPVATPAAPAAAATPPPESVPFAPDAATPAAPGSLAAGVQAATDQLAVELGDAQVQSLLAALAQPGEAPHAALGTIALLGQHLEPATWIFGRGVLAEPDNADYLNNFAVGLHEKALLETPADRALLDVAVASLEKATALQPGNAVFQSNLGFARLDAWRGTQDAATLQAAVDTLGKSIALDATSPAAWAHLGEARAAQSDFAAALEALAKARALEAFNGALLGAYARLPPEMNAELRKHAAGCAIDYGCKAQCPRSIIGQVNFVTCEVAQSSAQGACEAGRPYPETFDCSEQLPEVGILIPGLNSGFSLITPWGRVDVLVDGRGTIEYKAKMTWSGPSGDKVGAGFSFEEKGTWNPASGYYEVRYKTGMSFGYKGADAAKVASDHKMGPGSINFSGPVLGPGNAKAEIKLYGGTIFAH